MCAHVIYVAWSNMYISPFIVVWISIPASVNQNGCTENTKYNCHVPSHKPSSQIIYTWITRVTRTVSYLRIFRQLFRHVGALTLGPSVHAMCLVVDKLLARISSAQCAKTCWKKTTKPAFTQHSSSRLYDKMCFSVLRNNSLEALSSEM